MRKFLSKLDLTLIFRLSLSLIMLIAAFRQSDYVSGAFGLFLAFYALLAAKYKVGCGYNKC
jgi:predicted anti-sigma-YlaC factor YlaD